MDINSLVGAQTNRHNQFTFDMEAYERGMRRGMAARAVWRGSLARILSWVRACREAVAARPERVQTRPVQQ